MRTKGVHTWVSFHINERLEKRFDDHSFQVINLNSTTRGMERMVNH